MELFVNELPKSCKECKFLTEVCRNKFCYVQGGMFNDDMTCDFACPLKLMPSMTAETPFGKLAVQRSEDENFPGLSIYIKDEIVASVEFEKDKGLRVFTYGDLTDEDPTHIEVVKNIEEQLAKGEPYEKNEN